MEAVLRKEADGKRFLLIEDGYWVTDMARMMHAKYGQDYFISTKELFWFLAWLASFFLSEMAFVLMVWGQMLTYDNTESKKTLGIKYIPID